MSLWTVYNNLAYFRTSAIQPVLEGDLLVVEDIR